MHRDADITEAVLKQLNANAPPENAPAKADAGGAPVIRGRMISDVLGRKIVTGAVSMVEMALADSFWSPLPHLMVLLVTTQPICALMFTEMLTTPTAL